MTLTIEVSSELERKLAEEARRQGVSKDEFVRLALEEKLQGEKRNPSPALPAQPRIIATNLPVKDRSREYQWLAQNRDQYDGKYVALDGASLLAAGESYKEVAAQALATGVQDALLVFVEGTHTPPYVGGVW